MATEGLQFVGLETTSDLAPGRAFLGTAGPTSELCRHARAFPSGLSVFQSHSSERVEGGQQVSSTVGGSLLLAPTHRILTVAGDLRDPCRFSL